MTALNIKERFWIKVDRRGDSDCWEWKATRNEHGYGRFRIGRKYYFAHRIALSLGEPMIPSNILVLHSCDNPPCVNPRHLRRGTHKDNTQDTLERGQYHRWFGENSPRAKLNDEQVRRLREDHIIGVRSIADLSRIYGIGKSQIHNIVSGKQRKDSL